MIVDYLDLHQIVTPIETVQPYGVSLHKETNISLGIWPEAIHLTHAFFFLSSYLSMRPTVSNLLIAGKARQPQKHSNSLFLYRNFIGMLLPHSLYLQQSTTVIHHVDDVMLTRLSEQERGTTVYLLEKHMGHVHH